MRRWRGVGVLLAMGVLSACQTAQQARELRLISFDEDASRGKSVGPLEGSDCVYHVFGYWLGGQPTLRRAVMNARQGKHSSLSDSFGKENKVGGDVRYFNNMSVSYDGFNAGIFGKNCIAVSAVGYK